MSNTFRSKLAAHQTKDGENPGHVHVTDIRKESLFMMADENQTGVIGKDAFNKLYDAIRVHRAPSPVRDRKSLRAMVVSMRAGCACSVRSCKSGFVYGWAEGGSHAYRWCTG